MTKGSWITALKVLWLGDPAVSYYKLKQFMFRATLCSTLGGILIPFFNATKFYGPTPPTVPVIKSVGKFTTKWVHHAGSAPGRNVVFTTKDGVEYVTEDRIVPGELERLASTRPATEVYVEGFILQNGKGSFWPTSVETTDRIVLISEDTLHSRYMRNKFPIGVIKLVMSTLSPLWLIIFFNAYKIKCDCDRRKALEGQG